MNEVNILAERIKNLIELYKLYYISETEFLNAIPIEEIRKLRDNISRNTFNKGG